MRKIVLSIALAALSQPALAQTADPGPVVAVRIRPAHTPADVSVRDDKSSPATINNGMPPAASQSASPSVWAQVPRYPKTLVATQVAVYLNSCAFYSSGAISFPTMPQYGKATTEPVACTVPPGQACAGHTYSNCAGIYYERTARNNKSLRSPSTEGPVDIFTYKWDVPPYISETHSPDIAVPVVRPKGETNAFESWNEGKGRWRVTLVPPDNDPTFDFTGEQVRETYVTESDGCIGAGSSKSNVTTVVNGPPGNFGDSVGYSACAVEYARAKRKTPCGYRITQKMEISAPSDGGVFTQYGGGLNTLIAIVTGRLIDQAQGQHAIGTVSSQRITPLSTPAAVPLGLPTQRLDCLKGGLLGLQLMSEF